MVLKMVQVSFLVALLGLLVRAEVRGQDQPPADGETPLKRFLHDTGTGARPCLSWRCKKENIEHREDFPAMKNSEPSVVSGKPCLSWRCRRERLQQQDGAKKLEAEIESAMNRDAPCLSWRCRRENLQQQDGVKKLEAETESAMNRDAPCLSWRCKRERIRRNLQEKKNSIKGETKDIEPALEQ